jgi:transforming growth factor-beta-induced protein
MKKRLFLLITAFMLVFTIAACANEEDDPVMDEGNDEEVINDDEEEMMEEELNIIETAEAAGSFTTLLAALDTAGLTSALEAEGQFTVFAPTDDAFADLLAALDVDAATLLGINNLSDVLLYHVIEGTYYAADVIAGAPFGMETLSGDTVVFTVMDGKAYINGAEIVTTDIETSNGVIHVISEVILPLENIVDTADAAGSFTTLLAALDTAGLTSALEAEGQFTVFAPTDDAFADLLMALDIDASTLLGINNLSDVLLFHVLDGAYYSSDVVANAPFSMATLQGKEVDFTVMDGKAYINGAEIVMTDILTTNGVIHVISDVILPLENIIDTADAAGSFTTLLAALDTAGLTSALEAEGQFTVFAPTDDAFADLLMALDIDASTLLGINNLSDVLLFHVLDGAYYSSDVVANAPFSMATLQGKEVDFTVMDGKAYINGAEIVMTDILTTNGVIHVISEVILPLENIVDTAEAAGSFTTLLAALDTAGLTSTLEGAGSFTVFAPTDDAFADLLATLEIDATTLLGFENLSEILLFHVLDGAYYSPVVFDASPIALASLQGTNLNFTIVEGMIEVNGAQVIIEDILTTNGLIHVIDTVLLYE